MGKVKVVNTMDVDPIELEGLGDDVVVRPAIGRAQGSNRIQIPHSHVEEGFEAEASPRDAYRTRLRVSLRLGCLRYPIVTRCRGNARLRPEKWEAHATPFPSKVRRCAKHSATCL